jgi:ribosomal protein S18 acetylase RimI-like enzyme|tara:strand:- start:934 stop:1134 length:201 start_codon:yes stop_codon:yes gene_type:complete
MTLLHNLIESCKEKKIDNISLEVMELNKAAKNLYFKNNFIIYGKREKYYKFNDKEFDASLMKLNLR